MDVSCRGTSLEREKRPSSAHLSVVAFNYYEELGSCGENVLRLVERQV